MGLRDGQLEGGEAEERVQEARVGKGYGDPVLLGQVGLVAR